MSEAPKELDEQWEVLHELSRLAGIAKEHEGLGDLIYWISCSQDRNRHPAMEVRTHDGRRYCLVAVFDGVCRCSNEYLNKQKRDRLKEAGILEVYEEYERQWESAITEEQDDV